MRKRHFSFSVLPTLAKKLIGIFYLFYPAVLLIFICCENDHLFRKVISYFSKTVKNLKENSSFETLLPLVRKLRCYFSRMARFQGKKKPRKVLLTLTFKRHSLFQKGTCFSINLNFQSFFVSSHLTINLYFFSAISSAWELWRFCRWIQKPRKVNLCENSWPAEGSQFEFVSGSRVQCPKEKLFRCESNAFSQDNAQADERSLSVSGVAPFPQVMSSFFAWIIFTGLACSEMSKNSRINHFRRYENEGPLYRKAYQTLPPYKWGRSISHGHVSRSYNLECFIWHNFISCGIFLKKGIASEIVDGLHFLRRLPNEVHSFLLGTI